MLALLTLSLIHHFHTPLLESEPYFQHSYQSVIDHGVRASSTICPDLIDQADPKVNSVKRPRIPSSITLPVEQCLLYIETCLSYHGYLEVS